MMTGARIAYTNLRVGEGRNIPGRGVALAGGMGYHEERDWQPQPSYLARVAAEAERAANEAAMCTAIKHSGDPCGAYAMTHKPYCFAHEVAVAKAVAAVLAA